MHVEAFDAAGRTALVGGVAAVWGVIVASIIAGSQPASAAPAVSLYVAVGGSGNCTTQVDACGAIQTAINSATGGSYAGDDVTINVAAGTYTENDTIAASSLNSLPAGRISISTVRNNWGLRVHRQQRHRDHLWPHRLAGRR